MKLIKNKNSLILNFGAFVFCLLSISALGSFSLIWMQCEVSKVAKETVFLEKRHDEMLRRLAYLNERIAKEHQPIVLQSRVSERLAPVVNDQVVWVNSNQFSNGSAYVNAEKKLLKTLNN